MDMNYNFIIRNRPRKNGKPNYQLILSYRSKDGTWKQASKGGYALRSLAASDKEKEKLLAKVQKTGDIDAVFEGMTLREFGDMYISGRTTLAPNSIFTYRHRLASMTDLLDKPMVDITYADVSRMINGMRNAATSSIKGRVSLLKTLFREAVRYHVVTASPISDFAYKPREDRAGKPKLRTLSQHEVQTLLRYAHDHNREAWIVLCFAVYTGARIGEILALTCSDIDLEERTLFIRQQVQTLSGGTLIIDTPKTAAGKRKISIPLKVYQKLKEAKAALPTIDEEEHDLVFLNRAGTPVRPEAIEKMWKYLMSKSGLPYRNFHCLRHTHATLLLANGIPIIEVSRRLGHSSVTQTLDMYGHAIPCYDKTIAEKIDAIYN